jgi:hypothetical protein
MNPVTLQLRVMQITFIVSALLFYLICRMTPSPAQSVSAPARWVILLLAFTNGFFGFILQRMLRHAPNRFFPAAQDSTPLARWRAGHILRFATAEAVVLFGLALHSLGGSSLLVNVLFGSGLLLMLLWRPGPVPSQSESQGSTS